MMKNQKQIFVSILILGILLAGIVILNNFDNGIFFSPTFIRDKIENVPYFDDQEYSTMKANIGDPIIKKTYIYAGTLLASKSSENPSETQYYVQDHLGSNRKVINGQFEEQDNEFYAFGETDTIDSGSDNNNNYKYTGKELDLETGLYYYGARYYKPELGRFVQADVVRGDISDPPSLNRYAYVMNNPLKFIDPTGDNPATAIRTVTVVTEYTIEYFLEGAGAGSSRVSLPRVGAGVLGPVAVILSIIVIPTSLGDATLQGRNVDPSPEFARYVEISSMIRGDEEGEEKLKELVDAGKEYTNHIVYMERIIERLQFSGQTTETIVYQVSNLDKKRSEKHNDVIVEFHIFNQYLKQNYEDAPEGGLFTGNPEDIGERDEVGDWMIKLINDLGLNNF